MNVLFNIQNLNNINEKITVCLNHDFQLPNCITVDQNDLLIDLLSATTFSCLSHLIFLL